VAGILRKLGGSVGLFMAVLGATAFGGYLIFLVSARREEQGVLEAPFLWEAYHGNRMVCDNCQAGSLIAERSIDRPNLGTADGAP
jgi:hypothetical protein